MNKLEANLGGILEWDDHFLEENEATRLFSYLRANVAWQQKVMTFYGKKIKVPRLTAWFADNPNMSYSYSSVQEDPLPWNEELLSLKKKVENITGAEYNSVLLNFYRNGADSVDYHADDEKELGKNPNIASVSLGETRKFLLKQYRGLGFEEQERLEFDLVNGSLFVMSGTLQHYWKHSIPKQPNSKSRINLTFRKYYE